MNFNQGGNQILRPYKNSQFKYCQRLPLPSFVLSCFLFYGMVRNRISRVCSYFSSTERNSELFSLPLKGLKGIPRICFYFCSMERNSELFSLPWKGSERNSENFLFLSAITICSVYSVFHGIIFMSEILNLRGFQRGQKVEAPLKKPQNWLIMCFASIQKIVSRNFRISSKLDFYVPFKSLFEEKSA
jgi:hypothetical protein